jgi:hypothetical protein
MSCNNSSELYCSPAQDAVLFPDTNYTVTYNPDFWGLNGTSTVDYYLMDAENATRLAEHIPTQTNDGILTFTIDSVIAPECDIDDRIGLPLRQARRHSILGISGS